MIKSVASGQGVACLELVKYKVHPKNKNNTLQRIKIFNDICTADLLKKKFD